MTFIPSIVIFYNISTHNIKLNRSYHINLTTMCSHAHFYVLFLKRHKTLSFYPFFPFTCSRVTCILVSFEYRGTLQYVIRVVVLVNITFEICLTEELSFFDQDMMLFLVNISFEIHRNQRELTQASLSLVQDWKSLKF